jgi:hypothetical protein
MLRKEEKLELERIYKEYCNVDLESLSELDILEYDEFINMMKVFVKFRLKVSGGDESSMGSVGMNYVSSFLDEIFLYDNMMNDWNGNYRGDFCWECFDSLEELVNKSNLEENIKNEILEGYRKENGMDDDE